MYLDDLPLYVVPKSTPTIRRSCVALALEAAPISPLARFALDPWLKAMGTLPPLKGILVLISFRKDRYPQAGACWAGVAAGRVVGSNGLVAKNRV